MLIDEDEEGDEEIDIVLFDYFLTRRILIKVTQFNQGTLKFNKPPVSNRTPSRLISPGVKLILLNKPPGAYRKWSIKRRYSNKRRSQISAAFLINVF